MPKSKAIVETEHASRYLQQLCKHWSHKFAVEFTPEKGRIDLGEGRVTDLSADAKTLTVEIEASDLKRMEQVVEEHIVRFAFRETLSFDWKPID